MILSDELPEVSLQVGAASPIALVLELVCVLNGHLRESIESVLWRFMGTAQGPLSYLHPPDRHFVYLHAQSLEDCKLRVLEGSYRTDEQAGLCEADAVISAEDHEPTNVLLEFQRTPKGRWFLCQMSQQPTIPADAN